MILLTANSLKPFAYESIQILGLPNGSVFRARFPLRWVEKTLVGKTDKLVGKRLLYSVRIWDTDEVLPLRYGEITSAKQIGDILFLEYELGWLLSYSSDTKEQEGQLLAFRRCHDERLAQIAYAERAPGKAMQPLIVEVDEEALLADFTSARFTSPDDHMKWMTAVNLLGRFEIYHGVPFYKFEIFDKKTGLELHLEKGRAILKSGESYLLSTVHVVADRDASTAKRTPDTPYMEMGPYEIEVTTDQGNIEISPRSQPLSGRYDKFDFEFSARASKKVEDRLRLVFSIPKEISKSYRPIFEIPILFKPLWRGLIFRILGLVALSTVWLLLNFQDDIRDFLTPNIAEFIGQFSLVFFALTCVEFVKYIGQLVKSE